MESRAREIGNDESGSGPRTTSHGRGGAGNMKKDRRASAGPEDLATPTIKAEKYTTGRGGTGNMARNDPSHPEVARASQDVLPPAHREPEASFHIGRGGAANIAKPSPGEKEAAKQTKQRREKEAEEAVLVQRGKEVLETAGVKK